MRVGFFHQLTFVLSSREFYSRIGAIFLKIANSVVCQRIQVEFFLRCHLNCVFPRISKVFLDFLWDVCVFWKKFLKILDFACFCRLFKLCKLNACRNGRPTAAHSELVLRLEELLLLG